MKNRCHLNEKKKSLDVGEHGGKILHKIKEIKTIEKKRREWERKGENRSAEKKGEIAFRRIGFGEMAV